MENRITYFAMTDARNKQVPFGIKAEDRTRHMYVIGKTGMGKSTLLENMAVQDIKFGDGLAFIDPHGKTAELLLDYIPQERIKDVLYFAPFDLEYPISFNVMEDVGMEKRHLVANGLMSAFKKIWVDAWSARMEYILNNILLALLEYPGSTLIGVNRMLADKEYRKRVVENVSDPAVKSFWVDEFAKYGERYMQEAGAAIQNKIGQFISNPVVRNLIGQPRSSFDLRKIMDEKKILIINLSKGRVGEANANLLGSMMITKIYLAAMSRADTQPAELKKLPNFYLYVDEFQSFANESFADILSEARKYKLNLTIAHQYIEQMSEEVRAAVFGNVGTMIAFRVGAFDAEVLEKEFAPQFEAEDLVNLGFAQIYLKLMIDGVSSAPFSAVTLPPISKPEIAYKEEIVLNSRRSFARPRAEVEEAIRVWHEPLSPAKNDGAQQLASGDRPERERRAPMGAGPRHEGMPRRPAPSKDERERALRQTISLSYLKEAEDRRREEEKKKAEQQKKEHEERKKTKEATKENVNALRDALASVLAQAQAQAQPAAAPQQPPAQQHQPKQQKQEHSQQAQHSRAQTQSQPQPKQQQADAAKRTEVSADQLKKVLADN
jgi:hypothetical protein